jgi:hypothetical protein
MAADKSNFVVIPGGLSAAKPQTLEKKPGGPHDGGMDAWQTSVENRLGQIHTDIVGVNNKIDAVSTTLTGKVDRNFVLTWVGIIGLGLGVGAVLGRVFGIL